jgi:hypothetical protein
MITAMGRKPFFEVRVGAPIGVLVMLLVGCGVTDTATPTAPSVSATESSSNPTPDSSPAEESDRLGHRDTSGPSFGVDRVGWPATAKGAYKLFNALPQTLRGETLQVYYQPADKDEEFGATAGAQYGEATTISVSDEYITSDTESGEPELFTADQLLAASFGLVFGCAKKSYRGTIQPLEGGSGPGFGGSKRSSKPMWFSCKVDGAEGDDNFKGHAVGWTSRKAAWLVIAEDEKAARSLIAGLEMPTK